jgi:hypothetical protein
MGVRPSPEETRKEEVAAETAMVKAQEVVEDGEEGETKVVKIYY